MAVEEDIAEPTPEEWVQGMPVLVGALAAFDAAVVGELTFVMVVGLIFVGLPFGMAAGVGEVVEPHDCVVVARLEVVVATVAVATQCLQAPSLTMDRSLA